jgi:hypothetical protein
MSCRCRRAARPVVRSDIHPSLVPIPAQIRAPEKFAAVGLTNPSGVLLYGMLMMAGLAGWP